MNRVFKRLKENIGATALLVVPALIRRRQFALLDVPTRAALERRWIEPEMLLLPQFLSADKAFYDVGANTGPYTYVALKHLPAAHIYAFEPQMKLVGRLRALFPKVQVERCALSSKEGKARLRVPLIGGLPYLARGTLESFREADQDGEMFEEVPTRTLDGIRERSGIAVACIKIDVEGHEHTVLEGAVRTLERDKPVLIVEIEARHHREPITGIFEWIRKKGYRGYFFDSAENRFRDLAEFKAKERQRPEDFKKLRYVNNFVFVPEGASAPRGSVNVL